MRNKHVKPQRNLIVIVTMINDRHGAAACATSPVSGPLIQGTGIAKKEPGDANNETIAMNLAVGEALRDLGEQMRVMGTEQVVAAMGQQSAMKVRSALRRSNIPQHPERILLPLAKIEEEWGRKAAKVAANRRGLVWPPKKPVQRKRDKK
jgi:hypothetical protein